MAVDNCLDLPGGQWRRDGGFRGELGFWAAGLDVVTWVFIKVSQVKCSAVWLDR